MNTFIGKGQTFVWDWAGMKRRIPGIAAAVVGLAVLVGCGNVDTVMTVNPDLSGSRVMSATLQDTEYTNMDGTPYGGYVTGGAAALDASLKAHLPAGMDYSGLTDDVTTNDRLSEIIHNYSATFTIAFSDPKDYSTKVAAALAAGQVNITPSIVMQHADGPFHTGTTLVENFTSSDLLAWIGPGLAADGVIASTNGSFTVDVGNTKMEADGQDLLVSSPINSVPTDTTAITSVSVNTQISPPTFTRTVTMAMGETVYQANQAAYDAYFAQAAQGMEVTPSDSDNQHVWTVVITSTDPDSLAAQTNQLLGQGSASFSFTATPDPAHGNIQYAVNSQIDCSAVCAQSGGDYGGPTTANEQFTVPKDWRSSGGGWMYWVPITSIKVTGDPVRRHELDIAYTVPTADADLLDGGLTQLLTSADGSVATSKSGDNTIYTVKLKASSSAALNDQLQQYLPDSSLNVSDASSLLKNQFSVYLTMGFDQFNSSVQSMTAPIVVDLSTPGGTPKTLNVDGGSRQGTKGTVVNADTPQTLDLSITSTVDSFTWTAKIALIVLILVVVLCGILLIRKVRPVPASKVSANGSLPPYPSGPGTPQFPAQAPQFQPFEATGPLPQFQGTPPVPQHQMPAPAPMPQYQTPAPVPPVPLPRESLPPVPLPPASQPSVPQVPPPPNPGFSV